MLRANDDVAAAEANVTVDANGNVTATPVSDDFFFLPGRTGGQTANFSDTAGQSGTMQANPVDPNDRTITFNSRISMQLGGATSSSSPFLIAHAGAALGAPIIWTYTMPTSTTGAVTMLRMQGGVLKTGGGVPFVLFNIAPVFSFQAAQAAGQIFFYAPSFGDDGSVRTVSANTRMLIAQPNYRALTAGSTGTASTLVVAEVTPTVDASWNPMASVRFIVLSNPAGTHAVGITDLVGMDIPDTIVKPTNVFSIRNLEDRAKMVHRGAASFGDLATTVPPAGVALEVRSTIEAFVAPRMSGVQAAALVGVVPDGAQVYVNAVGGGILAVGMYQMTGGAWVAM